MGGGGGIHASQGTFSGMVIKEVVFSYEHENAITVIHSDILTFLAQMANRFWIIAYFAT